MGYHSYTEEVIQLLSVDSDRKGVVKMKIRNNDELKLFEETLDRCDASVLVVTAQGEQYDLKDPAQRYLGIAEMLREDGINEPELFASSYKDEVKLFGYLNAVA